MDLQIFNKNLKTLYWEIIKGYSNFELQNQNYFIKHMSPEDAGVIEMKENFYFNKAKSQNIPTNEERIDQLIKENSYDIKNDKKILDLRLSIATMRKTRSKLYLTRDLDNLDQQIKESSEELKTLEEKKESLLDTTCEKYVAKRMNEFYIYYSVYNDKDCRKHSFELEEFEELDQNELIEFVNKYYEVTLKFNHQNLKRIAVSNFFLNYFYLSDDNPYFFYGKPVSQLSFYQIELFGYARYFKDLMSKSTVKHPDEYNEDVDKLIDWYESSSNMEKLQEENNKKAGKETAVQAVSVMGATKEDLKKLKKDNTGAISLEEAAKKKGGALSFEDLIKLHGV